MQIHLTRITIPLFGKTIAQQIMDKINNIHEQKLANNYYVIY